VIEEKEEENQSKKDAHNSRISEIGGIYEAREFLHLFRGKSFLRFGAAAVRIRAYNRLPNPSSRGKRTLSLDSAWYLDYVWFHSLMQAYGRNQTFAKADPWGGVFRAATTFTEAQTGAKKSVDGRRQATSTEPAKKLQGKTLRRRFMKLRLIVLFFLCFGLLLTLTSPLGAAETPLKKVLLQVPISLPVGWGDPGDRIRFILKVTQGVVSYELVYDMKEVLYKTTVLFDEKRTTVAKIVDILTAGGYPIRGEPKIIP
jgi:hypothetical protein